MSDSEQVEFTPTASFPAPRWARVTAFVGLYAAATAFRNSPILSGLLTPGLSSTPEETSTKRAPDRRAVQWLALAAISILYFAAATLAWAFAAALVFGLAPELEFGIVVAMLLGVTAAAAGWAAYRLIDRLAGRASPWWDGTDAREGAAG